MNGDFIKKSTILKFYDEEYAVYEKSHQEASQIQQKGTNSWRKIVKHSEHSIDKSNIIKFYDEEYSVLELSM